jgi:uncharacterized protein YneF (UPF0154 family)
LYELLFIIPIVTGIFYLTRYLVKKFKRNHPINKNGS